MLQFQLLSYSVYHRVGDAPMRCQLEIVDIRELDSPGAKFRNERVLQIIDLRGVQEVDRIRRRAQRIPVAQRRTSILMGPTAEPRMN